MSDDAHVLDLLPAYVLGSLDADETTRVQEHLLICSFCRAESHSLEAVTAQLAFSAPVASPSAALRDRLMERARPAHRETTSTPQASKRSWMERLLPLWGVVSVFLIIGLAAFNSMLWQRLNRLEFAISPGGMRAIPLHASQSGSPATGFVIIGANGMNGALIVDGLPALAENQQYQVWLIREGQRTSGAIFSTDEQSYGGTRIRVEGSLLQYSSVDVTIEPAGGSPQPTGPQVLGGSLFAP